MSSEWKPFTELLSKIVDNRGRTCPVGEVGLPLIATNCIDRSNLYPAYDTTRFVSDETYKTWFRGHPLPGDILFVCKGSPGRTNWVPDPVDFCIAQDMVAVRANPERIYPKYLFAALRSPVVQSQIDNMHVGTMIPHFKKGDFDKLNIPVLSRNVQEFIGDYYFTISERIDLLRKTNTTLEGIAQALFKSWFVDFDPVRAKQEGLEPEGMDAETAALFPDNFEESELGLVPKGWNIGTIDQATSLIIDYRGKTPKKLGREWSISGIPAVSAKNIKSGRLVQKQAMNFVDSDLFNIWMKDKLKSGDILMTSEAPLGELLYLADDHNFCLSQRVFALRSNQLNCLSSFLYFWLSSRNAQDRLSSRATGTTVVGIRQSELRKVEVLLPLLSIQKKSDEILSTCLLKIERNVAEYETLTTLRDTLLPRLISGQLRLPDAVALVEEATA